MIHGARTAASQPRLLVSVRNAVEALAALNGGCDLLDIKEPQHGSLGMAEVDTIDNVVAAVTSDSRNVPVSVALGEVSDWTNAQQIPKLSAQLSYAKLGTARLGSSNDWTGRWRRIRKDFDQSSRVQFNWIAVAYVDWQLAQGPSPDAVVEAALSERAASPTCAGVLLDTYAKNGKSLLDWISIGDLAGVSEKIHDGGLVLALAGSLNACNVQRLAGTQPDIIAIRSAACVGGRRLAQVSTDAVREFKNAMSLTFANESSVLLSLDIAAIRANDQSG